MLLCLPAGSLARAQDITTESEKWRTGLSKINRRILQNVKDCTCLVLEHSSDLQYKCQLICVFHRPACQICWTWKRNFPASCCILSLPVIISLSLFFFPSDCAFYRNTKDKQFKRLFVYEILYRQLTCWKLSDFVQQFSPLHITFMPQKS